MKSKRHSKILEIIEKNDVNTQEALQQQLLQSGFEVTQATVSRDIKELKLVKTLSDTGEYKYSLPHNRRANNPMSSLIAIFSEAVISIDYALNTVVIKCNVGMAMAACAKLDSANFKNVVGTLAGDDTIFVLLRTENDAADFVENLKNLIKM